MPPVPFQLRMFLSSASCAFTVGAPDPMARQAPPVSVQCASQFAIGLIETLSVTGSSTMSWAVNWPHQLVGWLYARYTCVPARTRDAGCRLTLAELLDPLSGAALKQVISWTLLPPPVLLAKPKRNDAGRGPFESVMRVLVRTGCALPPLMLYEKSMNPSCLTSSE